MPSIQDALKRLRLSVLLQDSDPEFAVALGQRIRDRLNDPEFRARVEELGGPQLFSRIQGIIDIPLDVQNFAAGQTARRGGEDRGVLDMVSEGAANTMEGFGLDDLMLRSLDERLAGEGADISRFGPIPEESVDFPFLGEQNPITLGTEIASFLVPAAGAVSLARAGVGATAFAASHPALASTIAFALGGGTVEATRQGIRALEKGEEIDPAQIAIEAAIFGAGGTPVGGGAIGSRLRAGVTSGVAATVVPPLVGRDLEPSRVAAEVAFGLIFGNPRLPADAPVSLKDIDVEKVVRGKAGDTPLEKQLTPDPGMSIPNFEVLIERLKGVKKLSSISDEQLARLAAKADLTPEQAILLRDTVVSKRGDILQAEDLPLEPTQLPPKDRKAAFPEDLDKIIGQLAEFDPGRRPFRAPRGDPQLTADQVSFKGLTRKTEPLQSKKAKQVLEEMSPEQRLKLMVSLEDAKNAIKLERINAGKQLLSEPKLDGLAADRIGLKVNLAGEVIFNPTRSLPDTRAELRQFVIDDILREGNRLMKQADIESGTRPISPRTAEAPPPSPLRQELEQSIELQRSKAAELEGNLEAVIPLDNYIQAKMALDEITVGMTAKELTDFKIPQEMAKWENLLRIELNNRASAHLREAIRDATVKPIEKLQDSDAVSISVRGGLQGIDATLPRTKKGFSLSKLQDEAIERGAELRLATEPSGPKFDLVSRGQEFRFNTLKQVQKALDDIDQLVNARAVEPDLSVPLKIATGPPIPTKLTKPVVDLAGQRKLTTVQHVGSGRYQVVNKKTGKVTEVENLQEAARIIGKTDAPMAVEIGPVPPGTVSSAGGSGIGGPGSSGRQPIFDMPEAPSVAFPGPLRQWTGTKGELFKFFQDAIDIPVWENIWRPMMKASNVRDKFQSIKAQKLNKVFKGVSKNRMRVVNDLLIAGKQLHRVVREMNATGNEVQAAKRLRTWYQDVLQLKPEEVTRFFEVAIPEFRKVEGDINRVRTDGTLDGSLLELIDDVFNGKVDLAEPNALTLAQDILFAVGRKRFVQPIIKEVQQTIRFLDKQQRQKGITPERKQQLQTVSVAAQNFMDSSINGLRGGSHGESTAQVIRPFTEQLRKFGLIKEEVTARDVERWSSELSSYVSGAALSARAAPAFRNMWQRMLVGPKIGFDQVIKAQKLALTPEGTQLVRASGVIPGRVTYLLDDIALMAQGDKGILAMVQRAQSNGLYFYRKADHGNRGVAYLGGRQTVKDHAPLLREGKVDEFLIKTGMAMESTTIINRILQPLQNVSGKGWDAAVTRAGHEYGIRIAEDTQFIYNPANAPMWMQGIPGRFMGQFGIWPIAFTEYMLRNGLNKELINGVFNTVSHAVDSNVAGATARQAATMQFMTRYLAMLAAITAAEQATGVDLSSYNRANPLDFEGGPAWQAFRDVITLSTGSGGQFGDRLAWRNLERFMSTFWFPFGGAVEDISQASVETDPAKSILLGLGFTIPEEEK